MNEQTGYVNIDKNRLYADNTITFYVIGAEIPQKIEHLEIISRYEELSGTFRQKLEPAYT